VQTARDGDVICESQVDRRNDRIARRARGHGGTRPSQPASDVNVGQDKLIVAPYSYPSQGAAGKLPTGVQMALVAWHRLQTCTKVDLAAAFNFTARYEAPTYGGLKYLGEAREPQLGI